MSPRQGLVRCKYQSQIGRTEIFGDKKLSWMQETATKLVCSLSEPGKRWSHSNHERTLQNTTHESSSILWNNPQLPILQLIRGSVLWQSRLHDTVREFPMRCPISRSPRSGIGRLPRNYNHTDARQKGWTLLMFLCYQPDALKPLINNQSLPPEICLLCITPITSTLTICKAMKFTMRKKSIFLDCWYIACNRVTIMTCMICQLLGQYHWGTAADSNSPPSMEDTTKPAQSVTKPMIRPGEFS